jgi:hypothetical protein
MQGQEGEFLTLSNWIGQLREKIIGPSGFVIVEGKKKNHILGPKK